MIPGSGDATLLRFSEDGTEINVLVDGGNRRKDCLSYLRSVGVRRLNLMIASHLDEDHIRGLRRVADSMQVDELWITDVSPLVERAVESVYMLKCFYEAHLLVDGRLVGNKFAVYDGFKQGIGPFFFEVLSPPLGLHEYLRREKVIEGILRSRKGETIRRYVEDAFEEELRREGNVGGDESREMVVKRVVERFSVDVPQRQEIEELLESEEVNWSDRDKFFESARSLFNDISIVVKITYDYRNVRQTFLFPGDLTNWSVVLIKHSKAVRGCVTKVPHHGSEIYADSEQMLFCWLAKAAHGLFWKRLPHAWHHLWEEWYTLMRRYGVPPVPWLSGFGEVLPGLPISLDYAGLYEYFSPSHSLIYPYKSSFRLPRLDVRNAIKGSSRQISCSFKQGRTTARVVEDKASCIDCYGCRERDKPTVFEWSA
jgi:hypothetical protein